jgi:citrate lyase subunit alpha/citrate CoA-transferase
VDAEAAKCVVLLTEEWVDYPNYPASIAQDQVDLIVQVDEVGDPRKSPPGRSV